MADLFDNNNLDTENEGAVSSDAENTETEVNVELDENGNPVKKKRSFFAEAFDAFETFCYALVLMTVLFVFVFRFVTVNGTSMVNTLHHEDKLIISDMFYTPETGDIVVLNTDGIGKFSDKYIIKRIIATGGQKVEIDFESWAVSVDGIKLEEAYVNYDSSRPMESAQWINGAAEVDRTYVNDTLVTASFTVPEGMFFAMGDNRNGSSDSRAAGCFEVERILGRVLIRVGPMDSFGRVE